MDIFEELAMWHLTHNGDVFVCPQFSIDGGWSYPDFVALHPKERIVSVVEVSAAYSPKGLFNKVRNRNHQWMDKLKQQLLQMGIIDDSWNKFRVVLYVRKDAREKLGGNFGDDVDTYTLEEIAFPWNWEWISTKLKKETEEQEGPEAQP